MAEGCSFFGFGYAKDTSI